MDFKRANSLVCNQAHSTNALYCRTLEFSNVLVTRGFPKTAVPFLRAPSRLRGIVDKCGGRYKYLGLETGLIDLLQSNPTFTPTDNTILFNVNLNGVLLYKSNNDEFWPLLCRVGRCTPFVVALKYGEKKPDNVGDYLKYFIEKYQQLCQPGLNYQGNRYNIRIQCWVCEAPARSFLKGSTGNYVCDRCTARGDYTQSNVTYPARLVYKPLDNDEFVAMASDGDTHQTGQRCPLIDSQLNCVPCVVFDVMHNVYLGTWKRMLHF